MASFLIAAIASVIAATYPLWTQYMIPDPPPVDDIATKVIHPYYGSGSNSSSTASHYLNTTCHPTGTAYYPPASVTTTRTAALYTTKTIDCSACPDGHLTYSLPVHAPTPATGSFTPYITVSASASAEHAEATAYAGAAPGFHADGAEHAAALAVAAAAAAFAVV